MQLGSPPPSIRSSILDDCPISATHTVRTRSSSRVVAVASEEVVPCILGADDLRRGQHVDVAAAGCARGGSAIACARGEGPGTRRGAGTSAHAPSQTSVPPTIRRVRETYTLSHPPTKASTTMPRGGSEPQEPRTVLFRSVSDTSGARLELEIGSKAHQINTVSRVGAVASDWEVCRKIVLLS